MSALAVRAPSWFDEVRTSSPDILTVAAHLGLHVRSRRFGPCPACNKQDVRHPPLTPRHGNQGWMCAHCKATGDVTRLAAWVVAKEPRPTAQGWADVRAALSSGGWCSRGDGSSWTATPAAIVPDLPYPDEYELWRLLRSCRPIATSKVAVDFWQRRKFGAATPAAVLPDVFPWPKWWPFRGAPYSIVVSMVDCNGSVKSIHTRHTEHVPVTEGKTRWPYERGARSLLFADPFTARPMLKGAPVQVERLVIGEGITDYLAMASRPKPGLAVIGACSGGFGALSDIIVPKSVVAYIAVDNDAAGDRYAEEIKHALRGKVADIRRIPSLPAPSTP